MKNNFKPIFFSTPMVEAILSGKKTQTRRIINPQPKFGLKKGICDAGWYDTNFECSIHTGVPLFPKYQIGNILWVRETWNNWAVPEVPFVYRATDLKSCGHDWKPSIHMPKAAARIFLYVTNVRVERLRDISESDAISEGFGKVVTEKYEHPGWYINHLNKHHMFNAVDSFASMWVKLNGTGSWKRNPYVWVYDFEAVEKPKDF